MQIGEKNKAKKNGVGMVAKRFSRQNGVFQPLNNRKNRIRIGRYTGEVC